MNIPADYNRDGPWRGQDRHCAEHAIVPLVARAADVRMSRLT